ncbi:MAG: transglycosylase domain-containing protein, partial [Demequinaceae bacterium]|nr:transglycosylase domain-containing protein [Demequinaceae bacterium]
MSGGRPASIPPKRTGQTRTGQTGTGQTGAGKTPASQSTIRTTATRTSATGTQRTMVGKPKPPRPTWLRWLRKSAFWGTLTLLTLTTIGFLGSIIKYASLDIPEPDDFAQAQSSIIFYSDGETVIGRLGVANRENIDIEDLPEWVPHAIVAAEDRTFYTNPGVDFGGMVRAMIKTVFTGKKQGGSTITQQYVERYYVGETTTDIIGKWEEALLALKIDKEQDKDEILENYLNTVYFGRGAYGIQAAAREYYNKEASELTVSEAALLAGILPAPSAWAPRIDHDQAEFRWNYVLDGMVSLGYLDAADRLRLDFPEPIEYKNSDVFGGPDGYILRAAMDEVIDTYGLTQEA